MSTFLSGLSLYSWGYRRMRFHDPVSRVFPGKRRRSTKIWASEIRVLKVLIVQIKNSKQNFILFKAGRVSKVNCTFFGLSMHLGEIRQIQIKVLNNKNLRWNFFLNDFFVNVKRLLTDTGEDSKLVQRRKRPKMDTLFSSLFYDASERRVWLSAESKILVSTFGRFRLYRLTFLQNQNYKTLKDEEVWNCLNFCFPPSIAFRNFLSWLFRTFSK